MNTELERSAVIQQYTRRVYVDYNSCLGSSYFVYSVMENAIFLIYRCMIVKPTSFIEKKSCINLLKYEMVECYYNN